MSITVFPQTADDSLYAQLIQRIKTREALVGVIGLGYVGLPFAVEKGKVGFKVIGIDRNPNRVEMINRGENYIADVSDQALKEIHEQGLIQAMSAFERVPELDVIVIAVPTPLNKNLAPDLQYIISVTEQIALHLRKGQLISLESTTYPGTTEEVMLPILETSGLKVEQDFYLVHSPERVDPGNKRYTTKNTNKVIGGVGPKSLEAGVAFYSETIENVVPVSSTKAAELTKVFENTFRAVNIALVNELSLLCDRMDINVWEVLDAANTKPFGIMPFYPGPGVGGHCIPLDPHYLEWKAKEYNFSTRFIALAGEINRRMPEFVCEKTFRVLNEHGKAARGSNILLLGISYKKDIDDWRESPALDILCRLEEAGANVSFHDPYVEAIEQRGQRRFSHALTRESLSDADLVLILTDHTNIDYAWVVENARAVFDTRHATKNVLGNKAKVTLL